MEFKFDVTDLCVERTSEGKDKLYLFNKIEGDTVHVLECNGFFGCGGTTHATFPLEELKEKFYKVYKQKEHKWYVFKDIDI